MPVLNVPDVLVDVSPINTWIVSLDVEEAETIRKLFVAELEKVSFSLENEILSVTNVGNVPFTDAVEITIGEVN